MTSKLWQEFKAFAFKGNMIDLAIAVVIGAAFSGVVNSLVKDIIMPAVSYVTTAAQSGVEGAKKIAQQTESTVTGQAASAPSGAATTQTAAAAPPPPPPAPASPAPGASDQPVNFDWMIGRFRIGDFVASLLNFLIVAFAVFIMMVKLLGSIVKRVGAEPDPAQPVTKECPYCLSVIPIKARRCAFCTADLTQSEVQTVAN